jgi:predicted small secreted protein
LDTCRIACVAGTTLLKEQTMKRHSLLAAAVASASILLAGAANAATGFSGQADGMAPHAADRTGSSRTSSGPAEGGPLRSADGWVFIGEAGWVFDGRGQPGSASTAAMESRQMIRPSVNHGTSGSAIDGIYVGA